MSGMSGLASQSSRFQSLEMWPLPFPLRSCVSLSDLIISLVSWKILCKFLIPRKEFFRYEGDNALLHILVNISQCLDPRLSPLCVLKKLSPNSILQTILSPLRHWCLDSMIFDHICYGYQRDYVLLFLCRTKSIKIKVSSSIAWSYMVITMNGEEVLSLLSF